MRTLLAFFALVLVLAAASGCSGGDVGQMTDCMVRCFMGADTLWVDHDGEMVPVTSEQIQEVVLHPQELQFEVKWK